MSGDDRLSACVPHIFHGDRPSTTMAWMLLALRTFPGAFARYVYLTHQLYARVNVHLGGRVWSRLGVKMADRGSAKIAAAIR